MRLTELKEAFDIIEMQGNLDCDVLDVIVDSRKSAPGKMFVCIDGFTTDGHRFIEDAVKSGISALLVTKMPPKDMVLKLHEERHSHTIV